MNESETHENYWKHQVVDCISMAFGNMPSAETDFVTVWIRDKGVLILTLNPELSIRKDPLSVSYGYEMKYFINGRVWSEKKFGFALRNGCAGLYEREILHFVNELRYVDNFAKSWDYLEAPTKPYIEK